MVIFCWSNILSSFGCWSADSTVVHIGIISCFASQSFTNYPLVRKNEPFYLVGKRFISVTFCFNHIPCVSDCKISAPTRYPGSCRNPFPAHCAAEHWRFWKRSGLHSSPCSKWPQDTLWLGIPVCSALKVHERNCTEDAKGHDNSVLSCLSCPNSMILVFINNAGGCRVLSDFHLQWICAFSACWGPSLLPSEQKIVLSNSALRASDAQFGIAMECCSLKSQRPSNKQKEYNVLSKLSNYEYCCWFAQSNVI